jgi:predicted molibdopterin-dependent oxidoreductase YjgC
MVTLDVDGRTVSVPAGAKLLEACDLAGRYVPRLCHYPTLGCECRTDDASWACGLCLIRKADGSVVQACSTGAENGVTVSTDDPELRVLRAQRLAYILVRHPHICLSCPDRDGCTRDQCVRGNPPEARCCDELGRCEFGKLVAYVDSGQSLPRFPVSLSRAASVEGRIRRESGLCVGCGRCARVCAGSAEAGNVLEMTWETPPAADAGPPGRPAAAMRPVARPRKDTLRESGCTFCGQCVMVCPTGALTAPGVAGARWLSARREKHCLALQVLPPGEQRLRIPADITTTPSQPGVFTLLGASGDVLRIAGVADLRQGLTDMLGEAAHARASYFRFEVEPLYTQRETELLSGYTRVHGRLPAGNDLGDDLFSNEPE